LKIGKDRSSQSLYRNWPIEVSHPIGLKKLGMSGLDWLGYFWDPEWCSSILNIYHTGHKISSLGHQSDAYLNVIDIREIGLHNIAFEKCTRELAEVV
jgi:hypothetical protein